MKLISVALLLFAVEALAVNLQYSCQITTGSVGGQGRRENLAGGKIDEKQAKDIADHMASWSNDKFEASLNKGKKADSETLIVKCKNGVKTKTEALEAIKEQQKLVKDHKDA